ncbi:MAG: hypothetical protein ACERJ1_11010 [Halodesulfovibrio sp.]|uniref:hypothetical protein n=1 Tax=Halodesulfovibrio sp. TaxID=1912772 RepID=UPI00359E55AF
MLRLKYPYLVIESIRKGKRKHWKGERQEQKIEMEIKAKRKAGVEGGNVDQEKRKTKGRANQTPLYRHGHFLIS